MPPPKVGEGTKLGVGTVLEPGVTLGENCVVGNYVRICQGSQLGDGVRVDDLAVIGKSPLHGVRSVTTGDKLLSAAVIGNRCLIGTGAIVYRGAVLGEDVLLADGAVVREETQVGARTVIGHSATVENRCTVGEDCKIQTGAYLCSRSAVADFCFLGPGVVTSNDNYMARDPARLTRFQGVTMRRGARLGAGVVVLPGRIIEEEGAVGAGSVLTKDVGSRELWLGVPARFHRRVPTSQLLPKALEKPAKYSGKC